MLDNPLFRTGEQGEPEGCNTLQDPFIHHYYHNGLLSRAEADLLDSCQPLPVCRLNEACFSVLSVRVEELSDEQLDRLLDDVQIIIEGLECVNVALITAELQAQRQIVLMAGHKFVEKLLIEHMNRQERQIVPLVREIDKRRGGTQ